MEMDQVQEPIQEQGDSGEDQQQLPSGEERQEGEQKSEEKQEAAPKSGRKVRAVVNGEEQEIDLDDEAFSRYTAAQIRQAGNEALRRAAAQRQEAEQIRGQAMQALQGLKRSTYQAMRAAGMGDEDILRFAEQVVMQETQRIIDPQTGRPYSQERQEAMRLQAERDQLQRQLEEQQQMAEAQNREQMKVVLRQQLDKDIRKALESGDLPATPFTVRRMADLMQSNLKLGLDLAPEQIAPLVREDLETEMLKLVGSMEPERASKLLPGEWLDKLRTYDLQTARQAKSKAGFSGRPKAFPGNPEGAKKGAEKATDPKEAQKALDAWARGG